ncbi:FYVE zinc finger-domain-containing protein [Roridomyces roridus]|uniref:FYVE zinc finger-domain-containing protein n=1 Tax=Roridomyces roridus TaxID=1738132 RepID=A0AAD7BVY6_9AGAR|nr:FYVE zinc finger-domain-containing protein [Roridomyces roridus]
MSHIPYQAYKSKRAAASTQARYSASSRPPSVVLATTPPPQNGLWDKEALAVPVILLDPSTRNEEPSEVVTSTIEPPEWVQNDQRDLPEQDSSSESCTNERDLPFCPLPRLRPRPAPIPDDLPRKTSTFRRVPRNSRSPLPSSPLAGGHNRTVSASGPLRSEPPPPSAQPRPNSMLMAPSSPPLAPASPPLPSGENRRHSMPLNGDVVAASLTSVVPPARTSSLATSPPPSAPMSRVSSSSMPSRQATPVPSSPSSPSMTPRQASAPYRPGFQPKGVYRPRTDEFLEHRKAHAISAGYASAERTKLERRFEKLVALHFPEQSTVGSNRRASSFFDLDLKSILTGSGGKEHIRASEQRITPWQEDSSVTKCPLCTTNFHPLTNRKHHCRLCGQIICALPVKRPQRPELCSVLFVVDPKTRTIEEVGEGVDYGVRKRRTGSVGGAKELQEEAAEEEKFLRGVRICRECRPVLLRQQHQQQNSHVPPFVKLYEAFLVLEKEIEDSLPQFQELILSLNHDSQPTKEASAARRRLLEAFAQYDSLAKRIRNLPTPNGSGSSQERVQIAVMTRANLFLQKNMFPLQSLPKSKSGTAAKVVAAAVEDDDDGSYIDPSSATALTLQPLLEQEALLETFVEEAKAQRKFEDAKTLRVNLGEIRAEIERVLAAEGIKGKRTRRGR